MNKNILLTLLIPATQFGTAVEIFGPANIVSAAANRDNETMILIGKTDTDSLEGFQQIDGANIADQINFADDVDVTLDPLKWSQLATIERRNGWYALVASSDFAKTPAFFLIMDQIKKKKVKAFDTVFAHVDGAKKAWVAPMGKSPRTIYVDTTDVTATRFGLLGLLLTTKDSSKIALVNYADLANWYDQEASTIDPKAIAFENGSKIRSMSHVNGEALVVNTENVKYVLDLTALRKGKQATIVGQDTDRLGMSFAGVHPDVEGQATYVDFAKATTRFVPTSALPSTLQGYANQNQAAV